MISNALSVIQNAEKSIQALTDLARSNPRALSQSDWQELESAHQAVSRFVASMKDEPEDKKVILDTGITPVHQGSKKVTPVY